MPDTGHDVSSGDDDMRLHTYGQLLNNKLVVISARTGYVVVDEVLFFNLMALQLRMVPVDDEWYLAAYPDVREAISCGKIKSAAHHYARFGYFEHRMPRAILVDEDWYLEEYPDVRRATDEKLFASAQDHYDIVGFREGRNPYACFSLFTDKRASR